MNATAFDGIAKLFAARRLSRRQALTEGGGLAAAGLAATGLGATSAVAQEASPVASPAAEEGVNGQKTFYLFVQSFQAGSIVSKEGRDGTYTVTLEHGLGQTIYFADRPSRDVGAVPTGQFLEGLGFPPDNPPNAALVVEPAPGQTDIAVVELFNPVYDETGPNLTYDVEVLANWQNELELGFSEAPTDLAALAPSFGPAHLFIDDCPDRSLLCWKNEQARSPGRYGSCWGIRELLQGLVTCAPCWDAAYYTNECNRLLPEFCQGDCDYTFRAFSL